jgi:hypothetical protein
MNLNNTVWKLDGQSGNFGWFVRRYIEKLMKEKFKSTNMPSARYCANFVQFENCVFFPGDVACGKEACRYCPRKKLEII